MKPKTFVGDKPPKVRKSKYRIINKKLVDTLTANPGQWYYYGEGNRISFRRALDTYAKDWMIEMTARGVDRLGNGDIYLRFNP